MYCLTCYRRAGGLCEERMRENWKWNTIFNNTEDRELQIVQPGCILKAACTENRGVATKHRIYVIGVLHRKR